MICPYLCQKIEQISCLERNMDDNTGFERGNKYKLIEKKYPYDCAEENCAVWYIENGVGRCHYNG